MVAMNSMPQHDVANGSGHIEFLRAMPTTFSRLVAKKPAPSTPGGLSPSVTPDLSATVCITFSVSVVRF